MSIPQPLTPANASATYAAAARAGGSATEWPAIDELGQVSFRARPPDDAPKAVVEPDRVFEVACGVEFAAEQAARRPSR